MLSVRVLSAGLVTGLMAALLLAVPGASAAATSIALSRTSVIGGESTKVTGSTGVRVPRPVVLQRKSGTSWVKVSSAKTTRTGAFSFTTKPSTTVGSKRTLRVQAPKVKIGSKTYKSVTTGSRTVTTVAQTAAISAPATAVQGESFTVSATFTPTRAGRATALQQQVGS